MIENGVPNGINYSSKLRTVGPSGQIFEILGRLKKIFVGEFGSQQKSMNNSKTQKNKAREALRDVRKGICFELARI